MYKLTSLVLAAALSTGAAAQGKYPNVGRTATPAEIKAWDIDVRPDFKGLPRGSGSVKNGEDIWEAKCVLSWHVRRIEFRFRAHRRRDESLGHRERPDGFPAEARAGPDNADEAFAGIRAMGLRQPGHALERAQDVDPERGIRGSGVHPQPG